LQLPDIASEHTARPAKKPSTNDSLEHLTRAYGGIARKMLPSPNDQPAERSPGL